MVYAGLYPTDNVDYENLKDALEKLQLNDAALVYEPETSAALGFGFRCGFLGLLHLDVIQERLEREYGLNLVMTAPSVVYRVTQTDGAVLMIDNPAKLPPQTKIATIEEPLVKATVIVPSDYIGAVMDICRERRGTYVSMDYVDKTRVMLTYELPLAEILYDFFDRLKSMTRGYASLDYARPARPALLRFGAFVAHGVFRPAPGGGARGAGVGAQTQADNRSANV